MNRFLTAAVTCLLALAVTATAQNPSSTSSTSSPSKSATKKRGPVFRATKGQIKEAQATLRERNFYTGEQTGKLDDATRSGLKEYQKAEGLKITGTLNRITLEKMNIGLTDRQRTM